MKSDVCGADEPRMKPHPYPRLRPLAGTGRPMGWLSATDPAPSENGVRTGAGGLVMERRSEPRRAMDGLLSASYSDGESTFGIAPLEVVDRSETGMKVRTPAPLKAGMRVEIRGDQIGARVGTVVRVQTAAGLVVAGVKMSTYRHAA